MNDEVEKVDHAGCVMAIVGSRRFINTPDWAFRAGRIIEGVLAAHRPILVLSGNAIGLDRLALEIAKVKGYQVLPVTPKVFTWAGEGGLKERNSQIATACHCLIRIYDPASHTYGSGWTADQAEQLDKHVERYPITSMTQAQIQTEHELAEKLRQLQLRAAVTLHQKGPTS